MKILVFSDSHGGPAYIRAALNAHRGDTDAVYFLGDGIRDIAEVMQDYPGLPFIVTAGNCDSAAAVAASGIAAEAEDVRTLDGVKILALHGHTVDVKFSYDRLLYRATEVGADLVLFGHTHIQENRSENAVFGTARRIHLFNPGSVGTGFLHSYGVIYVIGGRISADHGRAVL